MPIPATTLYGAISVILLVFLGINASRLRGKLGHGETTTPGLFSASRAHGNMAEWLPAFIGVMLFIELGKGNSTLLHVVGGTFVVARLSYAIGRLAKNGGFTIVGAGLNYLTLSVGSIYALILRFSGA